MIVENNGPKRIEARKNLSILLQGQFVTSLGSQIQDIAVLLWLKQLTNSAAIMGIVMLLTNLPQALFAPFGGRIADKFGKVRVMVISDIVSAVSVGVLLPIVMTRMPLSIVIGALCLSNLIVGISSACFIPASTSLIPEIVPKDDLQKANASGQFCGFGSQVIGQGIGSMIFSAIGAGGAFALNSVSFLLSSALGYRIRLKQNTTAHAQGGLNIKEITRNTVALAKNTMQHQKLRPLLLYIAVFHLFVSAFPVSLPFFAQHALRVQDIFYGVFVASYTIGLLVGFVAAGFVKTKLNRFKMIAGAGIIIGLLYCIVAIDHSIIGAWITLLLIGSGIGIIIVNLITEIQINAPSSDRGAIMGISSAIGSSSLPIGMAATGVLLDGLFSLGFSRAFSVRCVFICIGVCSCVLGMTALVLDRRRQL